MSVEIAAFTEADRKELNSIYTELRSTIYSGLTAADVYPPSFDQDTLGEYILLAKSDNKTVGFVSAWLPNNFIHHLYIYKHYQGQGIGTQLLNAITAKLAYPITLKCLTTNTNAIQFYKKRGWVERFEATSVDGNYILFELRQVG